MTKHGKEGLCDASLKYTGSTSTLKYHLNTFHNITEEIEEKKVKYNSIKSIYL